MKPKTLELLEAMEGRMLLNDDQKRYVWNLQCGYRGECEFVQLMESLRSPHILLRDLYFEPKFSGQIQIDFLLLVGNTVIIYEVKNYSGMWQHSEEMYRQSGMERANPLIQLARTKNNFKALLRELGYPQANVDAVVFHVGSTFTLLGAPENRNVILPTQIQDHLTKLNHYQYAVSDTLVDLAVALEVAALPAPPFLKMIPEYQFESMRKGLRCCECRGFVERSSQRLYRCQACGHKGHCGDAVRTALADYRLLFPEHKISGAVLADWCGGLISGSQCRRILQRS